MAKELKLDPGWLLKDVRKAAERLDEWAGSGRTRDQEDTSRDMTDTRSSSVRSHPRSTDESPQSKRNGD